MRTPKRSDDIYEEIESFKDYELTQCIAYEMAIRNSRYQKQVDEVIDYYHNNNINKININNTCKIHIDKKISHHSLLCHKINQIDTIPFSMFEKSKIYEEPRYKRIYQIIEILHNANTLAYTEEEEQAKEKKYDKKTIHIENMDGYNIITTIIKDKWKDEQKGFEGMPYSTDDNKIENNFKRPKIKIDSLISAAPKLEIDLTLPISEICAYVKHIKKDIDKVKKAPFEILFDKVQKADKKVCPPKGKCFESKNYLTKQEKLADMLYIYDCLKTKKNSQKEIADSLKYYYYDKSENSKKFKKRETFSEDSIKVYKDIIYDYIDNERFIELVTGVKVDDIKASVKKLNNKKL